MISAIHLQKRGFLSRCAFWEPAAVSGWLKIALLAIVPLFFFSASAQAKSDTYVIAAYVFPGNTVLAADQVAARKLTRINFAFANIHQGRIVEGDPSDAANLAMLVGLKKENPDLTVLVSVGGWLWSGRFSDATLTPASRARFIDSVADFITRYNLDGLDIDWEYPAMAGAPGNVFRPEDKQNYTLVLKELRSRFNKMQKKLHRHLYITIAAGSTEKFLEHTEMNKVQKYVDTVNLMAYDYYEPGNDKITGNHAPLFADPADPKGVSADKSVKEFEAAGVPANKIVLGVPFYGHVWGHVAATNHGLFQPGDPVPNAYSTYGKLTEDMNREGFTRYWDAKASVPYLYNAQKQIFVSYEDPESLALKCKYVIDHRLAGMMFWEYESDPSGKLLDAVDRGLDLTHPATQPAEAQ
ncbi:MAG TPA: glycoside hydrolase family 18 protein [Acidobacteriaceae bacterium]|nr:glycoside hydrolase family 18 protein [Acidobacteriaceae bacterium]